MKTGSYVMLTAMCMSFCHIYAPHTRKKELCEFGSGEYSWRFKCCGIFLCVIGYFPYFRRNVVSSSSGSVLQDHSPVKVKALWSLGSVGNRLPNNAAENHRRL